MNNESSNGLRVFLAGILTGIFVGCVGAGLIVYKDKLSFIETALRSKIAIVKDWQFSSQAIVMEEFDRPISAISQKSFGKQNQLTFELYRNGTFEIDGKTGYAHQKSASYRDSAYIRNTVKLPKTYKISVVVGEIDYNLEQIAKYPADPEYPEGPKNENGCYLIAITDQKPTGHHTNIWWHQHRKLVIDIDNNVWGHGMPNPIFMVYFDRSNRLVAYDGEREEWLREWRKGFTYDPAAWYKIEVEKTKTHYILTVATPEGKVLKKGKVRLGEVWGEDGFHDDYFVIGDPHENYYQGSMKIKSIAFTPT